MFTFGIKKLNAKYFEQSNINLAEIYSGQYKRKQDNNFTIMQIIFNISIVDWFLFLNSTFI